MLRFHIRRIRNDESGATAVEYGLIAGLIAVVIIAGLQIAGGRLTEVFTYIGDQLAAVSMNS